MGLQRVRHGWVSNTHKHTYTQRQKEDEQLVLEDILLLRISQMKQYYYKVLLFTICFDLETSKSKWIHLQLQCVCLCFNFQLKKKKYKHVQ